jgi:3-phenylpropionate/trans-cinnamate dioxygenase ferredoxin subunit
MRGFCEAERRMTLPTEFLKVCATDDIAKGTTVAAVIEGLRIAIVHAEDDEFYAISDQCSHANVPLSEGEVEGCTLECWLHGSRFDLRTGKPSGLPATVPVPVYPVEVRDGFVFVSLTPRSGASSNSGVEK